MQKINVGFASAAIGLAVACSSSQPDDSASLAQGDGTSARVPITKTARARGGASPASGVPGAHLNYYGGKVISNVRVYNVYWNNPGSYQQGMDGWAQAIPNSTYLDWLGEYNTPTQSIGRGSFGRTLVDTAAPLGAVISDNDVRSRLGALIDSGALPAEDGNNLYMVYLPRGVNITFSGMQSCSAFCGYHFNFAHGSQDILYAVLPDPATCGATCDVRGGDYFGDLTSVASHELIEAVTDPDYPTGWIDSVPGHGEIGDLCAWQQTSFNGYVVQKEWSNKQNDCVIGGPSGGGGGSCATQICAASGPCTPGSGCTLRGTSPSFVDFNDYHATGAANHGWMGPCRMDAGGAYFCPWDAVTRGEAAAALVRALFGDTFPFSTTPFFSDVPASDWRFPYVQKIAELGIANGTGPGTFSPDQPLTRGDVAVYVVRAYAYRAFGGIENFTPCDNPFFTDVPPSDPSYRYVQELRALGITLGTSSTTFSPGDTLNRFQLSAFTLRAFDPGATPERAPQPCPSASSGINVTAGTYGANYSDIPRGNVTAQLAAACNGLPSCNYTIDWTVLGDPKPGYPKSYVADWTCNGVAHEAVVPPEAGFGSVVSLSCP